MYKKLLLEEKTRLHKQKEKNLQKIEIIDEKIEDCQKQSRHYATIIYLNNHELELYRKKRFILEKSMRFGLWKLLNVSYEKIRIALVEQENQDLEKDRTYCQNKIIYYKEAKKNLENQNITIGNKIFLIDDELNDNKTIEKPKTLKKEAKKWLI